MSAITTARHVSELPDSLLQSICSYLRPTSHLLFAVAVSDPGFSSTTSPPPGWEPSIASKAILATKNRDKIDFGDNEKTLVEKMTDDDLASVLWCMDGANKLKQLRLTNCVNIIGHGLSPLFGSTVLKQIDLSTALVHTEENDSGCVLSIDLVLPILYSIINQEGNSFTQLHLSKRWRKDQDERLTQFLVRYNQVLNSRGLCSALPTMCKAAHSRAYVWVPTRESKYGLQSLTCYECTNHICVLPGETNDYKNTCIKCEKTYCRECVPTISCEECTETSCYNCTHIGTCDFCHRSTCIQCMPVLECPCCHRVGCDDCLPMTYCSSCNKSDGNCEGCPAEKLIVETCDFCEQDFCTECREFTFCDDCGEMYCSGCKDTLHYDICSAKRARH